MTNNGFACVFQEGRLSTSTTDLDHNKYLGQISTTMRLVSSRDGDLLSKFDNINEKKSAKEAATSENIRSTSLNKMLITNHEEDANRGKIKCQLPLEHIFGFCKTFKKVTKNLGFRITFKTAKLQDIIYTTIAAGTQIIVTINSLYLFVPFLIPTTETQLMFNESIQKNYRIFFDEWYTERRIVADQIFQVNIGSARSVHSPKYKICAHQTEARSALLINVIIFQYLIILMLENILSKLMESAFHAIVILQTMVKMIILINIETYNYFIKNMLEKNY